MKNLTKAKVLILILFCALCIAVPVIIGNSTGNSPAADTVSDENGEALIDSVTGETIEGGYETTDPTEASSGEPDTENDTTSITETDTEATVSDMFPETSDTFTEFTLAEEPEDNIFPAEYTHFVPLTDTARYDLYVDYAKYIKRRKTAYDVRVVYYYGTYSSGEVVVMYADDAATEDVNYFSAGGYDFYLPSGSYEVTLHTGSTFIPLDEACRSGYLSGSDMAEIHYHAEHSEIEQPYLKLPAPELKPMTSEAEQKLKKDFQAKIEGAPMSGEDIVILCYYGTYNGGEVVVACPESMAYPEVSKIQNAGGYWFAFPGGWMDILFHVDSTFESLPSAYDLGYLSDNDMMEIHYHAEQLYPWEQFGIPGLYDYD